MHHYKPFKTQKKGGEGRKEQKPLLRKLLNMPRQKNLGKCCDWIFFKPIMQVFTFASLSGFALRKYTWTHYSGRLAAAGPTAFRAADRGHPAWHWQTLRHAFLVLWVAEAAGAPRRRPDLPQLPNTPAPNESISRQPRFHRRNGERPRGSVTSPGVCKAEENPSSHRGLWPHSPAEESVMPCL